MGGPEYSKYVFPYAVKGAPIDMCFPKEGAFAGVNCQVFVKGGPNAAPRSVLMRIRIRALA